MNTSGSIHDRFRVAEAQRMLPGAYNALLLKASHQLDPIYKETLYIHAARILGILAQANVDAVKMGINPEGSYGAIYDRRIA